MIFNGGSPVFIEFTPDGRIFEIVVEVERQPLWRDPSRQLPGQGCLYISYEVDWCDSHEHYHAHEAGSVSFPHRLSNSVGEGGERVSFCYWVASPLTVEFYENTDTAYCVRIGADQLLELFLPDPEHQQEFLFVSEIPTLAEMNDEQVGMLLDYWERYTYSVEEGDVIWCPLCKMHYDYEDGAPCVHIRWCDVCGFHSVPPDSSEEESECPHRSADGGV